MLVPAGIHELRESAIRHREPIDFEAGHLDPVLWALIVVGLGSLVGAEQKRPAWDQDPLGVIQMIHRPRWSKTRYGVWLEIFSKIQGLKNDFVVLRLMLNDHLEHIAIPKQRIVGIEFDPVEDR